MPIHIREVGTAAWNRKPKKQCGSALVKKELPARVSSLDGRL